MRPDSKRTINLALNVVMAPAPTIDNRRVFEFQRRLAEEKIEFAHVNRAGHQAVFVRERPSPLQVQVGPMMQGAPIGQLMVSSTLGPLQPEPTVGVNETTFEQDADTILLILREVWPESVQVGGRNAGVSALYDCGEDHAFYFLWERRLGQPADGLTTALGRRPLGGGIRLVMPATSEDPTTVEIKVESFFQDMTQLYVETNMQWPQPSALKDVNARAMLEEVQRFLQDRVVPFIEVETRPFDV